MRIDVSVHTARSAMEGRRAARADPSLLPLMVVLTDRHQTRNHYHTSERASKRTPPDASMHACIDRGLAFIDAAPLDC